MRSTKKPRRGVCGGCGCTDSCGCSWGCWWVDKAHTKCSSCFDENGRPLRGEVASVTALERERDAAERKAIDALGRYKFTMFGYWAGLWVHLNNCCPKRKSSPFARLVKAARSMGVRKAVRRG